MVSVGGLRRPSMATHNKRANHTGGCESMPPRRLPLDLGECCGYRESLHRHTRRRPPRSNHMRSPLRLLLSVPLAVLIGPPAPAADLPRVTKVELQPLAAQVQRVADALDFVGNPL